MTVVLLAYREATQAAGPTEADWIRWAGLILTFAGTLVAAPSGAARLFRAAAWPWRTVVFVFGGGLGAGINGLFRIFGLFGRALVEAYVRKSSGGEPGEDIAPPTRTQVQWVENELLEAKVERLRSALEQAFEEIFDVRRDAQSADAELRAALDQVSRDLQIASASLNFRMDQAERRAATIDSRGVLLLGVGVILTVIPDGLALVGWVGWLAVGISGFLLLSVLLAVGREWHGHHSKATAAVS